MERDLQEGPTRGTCENAINMQANLIQKGKTRFYKLPGARFRQKNFKNLKEAIKNLIILKNI